MPTDLKAHDKVRVTLRDGTMTTIVIAEVQADALMAKDGERFTYADIARLEKTRVSKGKTIALTAGLIMVGFVMAIALAVASGQGNI